MKIGAIYRGYILIVKVKEEAQEIKISRHAGEQEKRKEKPIKEA